MTCRAVILNQLSCNCDLVDYGLITEPQELAHEWNLFIKSISLIFPFSYRHQQRSARSHPRFMAFLPSHSRAAPTSHPVFFQFRNTPPRIHILLAAFVYRENSPQDHNWRRIVLTAPLTSLSLDYLTKRYGTVSFASHWPKLFRCCEIFHDRDNVGPRRYNLHRFSPYELQFMTSLCMSLDYCILTAVYAYRQHMFPWLVYFLRLLTVFFISISDNLIHLLKILMQLLDVDDLFASLGMDDF